MRLKECVVYASGFHCVPRDSFIAWQCACCLWSTVLWHGTAALGVPKIMQGWHGRTPGLSRNAWKERSCAPRMHQTWMACGQACVAGVQRSAAKLRCDNAAKLSWTRWMECAAAKCGSCKCRLTSLPWLYTLWVGTLPLYCEQCSTDKVAMYWQKFM